MNELEAIERIQKFKHFADLVESPEEYFQHMQGHTKELSLILNVFDIAEISEMIVEALEKQINDRWIPVSERLPENGGWYLITTEIGKVDLAHWFINEGWKRGHNSKAIAWKPLPKPYKEVSE